MKTVGKCLKLSYPLNQKLFENLRLLIEVAKRNTRENIHEIASLETVKIREDITCILRNCVHQFNRSLED